MNHSSFTVAKADLFDELLKMTKTLGRFSKAKNNIVVELTITDNLLTLVIPGIKIHIKCKTVKTVKASIGLYYFKEIINNSNNPIIECSITNNAISIGGTTVSCQTTFFETDSILRSIKLPINYTDIHVLQLENKGYTEEEIRFNNLEFVVYNAQKRLFRNIENTTEILGVYGFSTKEIKEIVYKKLKI